jgi:trk system potassium uptake protein TrkH
VHLSISLRILGLLLTLFSVAMLPPLLIAVLADDDTVTGFLSAFGIT